MHISSQKTSSSRSQSRTGSKRTKRASRATINETHRNFMQSLADSGSWTWQEITDRVNRRYRTDYSVFQTSACLGRLGYGYVNA